MPINNSYRNKANRILDECIIRNNYDNNNNNNNTKNNSNNNNNNNNNNKSAHRIDPNPVIHSSNNPLLH